MQRIPLSNGTTMPSICCGCAFGNWTGGTAFQGFLPEQAYRATTLALQAGLRHFDGAHVYSTERAVGSVLGRHFADGVLTRDDVFLTALPPRGAPAFCFIAPQIVEHARRGQH